MRETDDWRKTQVAHELDVMRMDLAQMRGRMQVLEREGVEAHHLQHERSGLDWVRHDHLFDRSLVAATYENTTDAKVVYTKEVPGGMLGLDRGLRLTLIGGWLNNSGANRQITIAVAFGALTAISFITAATATSTDVRPVSVDMTLMNIKSPAVQSSLTRVIVGGTSGAAISNMWAAVGSGTVDTTKPQTLSVTITHSFAHADIDFYHYATIVEHIGV